MSETTTPVARVTGMTCRIAMLRGPRRADPSICRDGSRSARVASLVMRRQHGNTVIDGGYQLMFEPTADLGHKVLRVVCRGPRSQDRLTTFLITAGAGRPARGGSHALPGSRRARQGPPGPA